MVSSFPMSTDGARLGFWWIAEDHPDLPAVLEAPGEARLSFGDVAGRAHQLVHALRSRGFRPGDIVAYVLPNCADNLYWQFACQESGMTGIALNPQLSAPEVRSIMEHSSAVGIVVHHQFADRLGDFGDTSGLKLKVSVGGAIDGYVSYTDLIDGRPTTIPEDRRIGGYISYSSGTTGKPKAIVRPTPEGDPSQWLNQSTLFGRAFSFTALSGVHLVSAGMHHGGCQSYYQGALNMGQALVIMAKFDPEETLRLIQKHRVSTAYMVPTQFVRLLRLPEEVRNRYDLSSLSVVVHSAAPCPVDIKQQMMDWWGPVIWETYGGMEGAATIAKPYRWLEKPGTVGRAVKGMTVKILDDEGRELPAGEVGSVYMESVVPASFEYKDDPDLTASVKRGRAFTIGDVGYLDADGYLFLRDRAKDMIISGGVNIYPAEVEAVLTGHPAVGDVAVIGIPNAEWGEEVKAVVELTGGYQPSDDLAAELMQYCQERLAKYKCPRTVEFREQLPRTNTGKLLKRTLRDPYWAGMGRSL
ncbi:MAG: putative acyl-CoA synthetase, long-chain fatty acid:CoA ligase [Acidimicrobiia bacterium]|nr:putative acyl-CoA synthetase, long-chain fatty acid:CoA ligase [Acidimicrobiia bacterium]